MLNTRRPTGELIKKLFEILIQYPDGLRAHEALEKLASSVTLNDYETGVYESTGSRRFEKLVRFETIIYVKAGWLIKHKGNWAISEEGINAYNAHKDPELFYKTANRLYHQWKSTQKRGTLTQDKVNDEIVEENSSITFEQAEEQALAEVEQFLKRMNPYDFQELVADLLRGMGYYVSWVSPPGKDGGVDVIAHPDPLGTQSPRLKVQVKRQDEQKVDRRDVSSFLSTIGEEDAGLFVCTSGFTKDAKEFARGQEKRKIMLIDWEEFFELWTKFYSKLEDVARRRFPITPIYFLTPET